MIIIRAVNKSLKKVLLIGAPNVGKSAIFNYITASYVTVSNYPGTTVDVSRSEAIIKGIKYEIIDTPGIYTLNPLTEEERVTRQLLFSEKPDIVVHVIDTKNIRRMLVLTLQLLDAGLPIILNLNMIDESKKLGIRINTKKLSEILGIPVNCTSVVKRYGLDALKMEVGRYKKNESIKLSFTDDIENAIMRIEQLLRGSYGVSKRMAAQLLLQGDELILKLARNEPEFTEIEKVIEKLSKQFKYGLDYILTIQRQHMADKILDLVINESNAGKSRTSAIISRLTREPLTGLPIMILVIYFGLYMFVGQFGAGYLVDCIDEKIFGPIIFPCVQDLVTRYIHIEWLQSLIIGEYGIFSLGFRYAVVIILPIVGTFFLVFAFLEDCGYLPRLALLVDQLFKKFGLNGRAVIPITLGLGCGTMAVMVTRTLESKKERLIVTFMLSLAIPCSAQLGLVLAILSNNVTSVVIWGGVVGAIFALSGWLCSRLIPGEQSAFYLELPPMRIPILANIITKAYTRMAWYFLEILPVFIITSVILWGADRFGFLATIIKSTEPVMLLLGLPAETAQSFLLGFFRRDYGTAGLYDMCSSGLLNNGQLLVAAVTLTLFVPCVAQFTVMVKERGLYISLLIIAMTIAIAFVAGLAMHYLLVEFGSILGY